MTRRAVAEYRRSVLQELDAALADLLVDDLPDPADFVRFGMAARRPQHALADIVGPVYTTGSVAKVLGLSRQQLDDRRKRGTILALRTGDGHWVYPAFQFADGAIRPAVREILDIFRHDGPDAWTLAAWFASGKDALGGKAPIELLDRPDDRDAVRTLARETNARWAA